MCNTPHWGYVIEGSMKVIYADGKEETFMAGEVFYMPVPHTVIIDKNVKFVDFSPHKEHAILMDQIAKNIAAFQENN
jgi:quercetin dioxygenase-like cupin family protein